MRTKPLLLRFLAICAAVVFLTGSIHSLRAATSHALYLQARYGLTDRDAATVVKISGYDPLEGGAGDMRALAEKILSRCERAHRLYPFNYNFCELASTAAFRGGLTALPDNNLRGKFVESAGKWCNIGLQLNPRSRALHVRKTSLLKLEGRKVEAAEYWRKYTEWHFWDAENHYLLTGLYGQCGKYEEAIEAQRWWKILSGRR